MGSKSAPFYPRKIKTFKSIIYDEKRGATYLPHDLPHGQKFTPRHVFNAFLLT
ncbi:hypothetical protein JDXMQMMX_CDS76 [Acinetobacter phage vB_AbaM_AB4P2]|nr:hypothetical protein JDXMQMMX_CDS76 [Acinetobacter phage vB_AbaM_AB4P2]